MSFGTRLKIKLSRQKPQTLKLLKVFIIPTRSHPGPHSRELRSHAQKAHTSHNLRTPLACFARNSSASLASCAKMKDSDAQLLC